MESFPKTPYSIWTNVLYLDKGKRSPYNVNKAILHGVQGGNPSFVGESVGRDHPALTRETAELCSLYSGSTDTAGTTAAYITVLLLV